MHSECRSQISFAVLVSTGEESWGSVCVICSTLHHHSTLRRGLPCFWLYSLCLWIRPRPQHHPDTLINHWSLLWFQCWILQGGAMLAALLGPLRSKAGSHYFYPSAKLSAFLLLMVLGSAFACVMLACTAFLFCLHGCKRSCLWGEKEAWKNNRKNEERKKCSVRGLHLRIKCEKTLYKQSSRRWNSQVEDTLS